MQFRTHGNMAAAIVIIIVAFLIANVAAKGEACTLVTQRVQCHALTCNVSSGDCMLCTTNEQCYDEAYECNGNGNCVLMPLSSAFSVRTLLAPLTTFVVCAVAVLAGVGGGAILSPLYDVILGIPLADAVALAQCAILGQSVLNVVMQLTKNHRDFTAPTKPTRPIINYEYVCLLLPMAIAGTFLGSIGNKVSPDWLRVVFLILLFTNALYRLIQKMLAEKRAMNNKATTDTTTKDSVVSPMTEQQLHEIPAAPMHPDAELDLATASAVVVVVDLSKDIPPGLLAQRCEEFGQVVDGDLTDVDDDVLTIASGAEDQHNSSSPTAATDKVVSIQHMWDVLFSHPYVCLWAAVGLGLAALLLPSSSARILVLGLVLLLGVVYYIAFHQKQIKDAGVVEDKPQLPTGWLLLCLAIVAVFTTLSYLSKNAMTCGGAMYYGMMVIVPATGMLMAFGVRRHLSLLHAKVQLGELPPSVIPFIWNDRTTKLFPIMCIVAGFAASMLGIGGGLVLSSLLLEAGLGPAHASATSGLATLLIAMQSVIILVIGDKLRMDYGLMCFAGGLLSTMFGRLVLMRYIERTGATYLIVAALAFIMGGSMVAIISYGIWNSYNIFTHDGSLGFGPMCSGTTVAAVTSS